MENKNKKYKRTGWLLFVGLFCFLFLALLLYINGEFIGLPDNNRQANILLPVAVLGDSDSHSYRDSYDSKSRGGAYHAYSYNWLELWARLSEGEIYPGQWGVWGTGYRIAHIKNMLMLKSRSPKKLDYEYDFAVSGLGCRSLLDDWPYQGKWLLNELRSNPEYWASGLVIIKIGINDIGKNSDLIKWRMTGLDQQAEILVSDCVNSILKITKAILDESPGIRVAISGVTRNYNFMDEWDEKLNKDEINNIEKVLSAFDTRLQNYADDLPTVAYIDDHFWFNRIFGSQESGNLKSKIEFIDGVELINASGDEPVNMLLQDHHTGTLYNGLWIAHLVNELNKQLGMTLSPPNFYDVIKTAGLSPGSNRK